jgi:NADH:ubiquinone oxidoreductase subunit F (NADH-binding)/(2Fe-2S) ferredoxin
MSSAPVTPDALTLKICAGTGCVASGALRVAQALREAVAHDAEIDVRVEEVEDLGDTAVGITGCHGFCAMGPLIGIPELGLMYCRVGEKDVPDIVETTLRQRRPVEHLLFENPADGKRCASQNEIPFFSKQMRKALLHCGDIDPENIDDYLEHGGYDALRTILREKRPSDVVDEIKRSGLQGRGGAGFPTGMKWELVAGTGGGDKYIVCNGDEGDPGAFMDRSVMEGDPHAVIEGMTIAAFAVGACHGYVYVRAEYPLAVRRMQIALQQASERGFLGQDLQGTGFNFDISIVEGAGAFVCGEETALLNSIEGRRGMPSPRPPYPANRGLWGRPTLINNVETFANVPKIIDTGAAEFAAVGTTLSKGTKTFALTGKVNNIGLVEVPMGITLREIIFDIGGGIPDGKRFKAAQTGGPSGGCIPAEHLDTPIDYKSLQELGSMMGSGGLVVMDESVCMVKVAKFFMEFCVEESCGKCPPCRIGNQVMLNILERICDGQGQPGDVERLEALGEHIQTTSLCGLGQSAPNPTLSTIRHFRHEYDAHIHEHECPARECYKLVTFFIEPSVCKGCTMCKDVCSAGAISGERKHLHMIDEDLCLHCGSCLTVCTTGAVQTK